MYEQHTSHPEDKHCKTLKGNLQIINLKLIQAVKCFGNKKFFNLNFKQI